MLEAVERAIGFAKEEGEEGDRGEDIAEDFSDPDEVSQAEGLGEPRTGVVPFISGGSSDRVLKLLHESGFTSEELEQLVRAAIAKRARRQDQYEGAGQ